MDANTDFNVGDRVKVLSLDGDAETHVGTYVITRLDPTGAVVRPVRRGRPSTASLECVPYGALAPVTD